MDIIWCQECGRPFGALLGLGETPNERLADVAQQAVEEALIERLENDGDSMSPVFLMDALELEVDEVVLVTEATGKFWSEHLNTECLCALPSWQSVSDLDVPDWALRGRRRRWMYRWSGCCAFSSSYVESTSWDLAERFA